MPTVSGQEEQDAQGMDMNSTEGDSQSTEGDSQSADDNAQVNAILDENQVDAPEVDNELQTVVAADSGEQDSFSQDIADANQAGESEDVIQLTDASAIVASVSSDEVKAVSTDDVVANNLIVGTK